MVVECLVLHLAHHPAVALRTEKIIHGTGVRRLSSVEQFDQMDHADRNFVDDIFQILRLNNLLIHVEDYPGVAKSEKKAIAGMGRAGLRHPASADRRILPCRNQAH
jgi:hypothetical protein